MLSGATIPGQCGPGSNGSEGVLHIPQSSCITGKSPSYCLMSLGMGSYPSAEMQLVYSAAPLPYTKLVCSFLFLFNGISTFVSYIMPM